MCFLTVIIVILYRVQSVRGRRAPVVPHSTRGCDLPSYSCVSWYLSTRGCGVLDRSGGCGSTKILVDIMNLIVLVGVMSLFLCCCVCYCCFCYWCRCCCCCCRCRCCCFYCCVVVVLEYQCYRCCYFCCCFTQTFIVVSVVSLAQTLPVAAALRLPLPMPRLPTTLADQDRISDFQLKLMDIDSEHLGIPETEYKCSIKVSFSILS